MRPTIFTAAAAIAVLLASGPAEAAAPSNNHQLDASFAQADKNKDGFLDAEELAKAFRGPTAKVIADKVGAKGETHPDHAFMDTWDANNDGKVSKAEFEKYEAAAVASAKTAANRAKTYTRAARPSYRAPQRHGGYSNRGYSNRGYSSRGYSNPYQNYVRNLQRAYQQQRQAYFNRVRYGTYSPQVRGGYRGVTSHRHGGRR